MAAPREPAEIEVSQASDASKRKRKKGRFIKQSYSRSECRDARRVAARAFLSSIPLDNHPGPNESFSSQIQQELFNAESAELEARPSVTVLASHHRLSPIKSFRSLDYDSPPDVFERKASLHAELGGCVVHSLSRLPPVMLQDKPLLYTSSTGSPFALSSVTSYKKQDERLEGPQRMRVNSVSLQIELDIDLDEHTELSLGYLFSSLWTAESLLSWQPVDYNSNYPWAVFKDNHNPDFITTHYDARCLDNPEHFTGSQTHHFKLEGKMVSVIQYARPSDVKRAANEKFSSEFPHIRLTLSKLRSIKHDMLRAMEECEMDLDTIAYSFVYYERMVLMGKINKANRKIIAGVCLLLAAKFYSDIKQKDIKQLVMRLAELVRVSSRELIMYEFPVLVSLQFSLLVPPNQARPHLQALRDSQLALN